MITREQFLKDTNEEELFAVFESVYVRAIQNAFKTLGFEDIGENKPTQEQLSLYLTDKEKGKAIKATLRAWLK